jgi:hypothetical protein
MMLHLLCAKRVDIRENLAELEDGKMMVGCSPNTTYGFFKVATTTLIALVLRRSMLCSPGGQLHLSRTVYYS